MTMNKFIVLLSVVIAFGFTRNVAFHINIPTLKPGDVAPPFVLQTLLGQLVFSPNSSVSNIRPPMVFHAFTNKSGFLEALLQNRESLIDLIANSPENTHYVFMSWDENAFLVSKRIKGRLIDACRKYHIRRWMADNKPKPTVRPLAKIGKKRLRRFPNANPPYGGGKTPTMETFYNHWKNHLHFVTVTIPNFGNWIPRLLKQWYCNGPGCGLDQIAFLSKDGDIRYVTKRLDARYDWLPSPKNLNPTNKRLPLKFVGDACVLPSEDLTGSLAVVTMSGRLCSCFTKVLNCENKGASGVIVVNRRNRQLFDMNCHGKECATKLHIPATMIPFNSFHLNNTNLYAQFQTTPWDAFFFAIDNESKLQESGWFLYPSMLFMAYQAQWMNYQADLKQNLTKRATVVNIFKKQLMDENGLMATAVLPPVQEMQQYANVELDFSLSCPGSKDRHCPTRDSILQLFVCCEGSGQLCGQEIGRWHTAVKRHKSHWLTPVRPLVPLFTTNVCRFTVKTTPSCTMPWVATLNIRFTDKVQVKKSYKTFIEYDKAFTPFMIQPLFRGGIFDQEYNKKYLPISFILPNETSRVRLVATITGHGRDNNSCAELCVTSHNFVINGIHNNTRIYKDAGTTFGCAAHVKAGVAPNEYVSWMYGRGGWCDGQEVTPWIVDVTDQVKFGSATNSIRYFGLYNGKDPNPSKNPGNIIMYSYLVFYKYL